MSSTDLPEENGSGELPSAAGGSRPAATEWCAAAVRLSCAPALADRKSTNSSHSQISYAVFCLKKKKRRSPDPHTPTTYQRDKHLPGCPFTVSPTSLSTVLSPYVLSHFFRPASTLHRAHTLLLHSV